MGRDRLLGNLLEHHHPMGKMQRYLRSKRGNYGHHANFCHLSGGCGASQTMSQLIANRAFQGIGAAGCWSTALVVAYEMVPKDKYPATAAELGAVSALGSLVGPVIGGGISERSTWRWAFLLSVPAGVITWSSCFCPCRPTSPTKANHRTWRLLFDRKCLHDLCQG